MTYNNKSITREKLYKQVWEQPTTKVAKMYGVSDVAISKICKKLNVPKPPLGYWAKIQNGIKVDKAPLPKLKNGDPDRYHLSGYKTEKPQMQPLFPEVEKLLQKEIDSLKNLNVKQKLIKPHPLIQLTQKRLNDKSVDQFGRIIKRRGMLDVRVSPKSLNRALRILDSIITYLDKRGYPIENNDNNTSVTIIDEKVEFYMLKVNKLENILKLLRPNSGEQELSLTIRNNYQDGFPGPQVMPMILTP